jgi:hypothetical protein
MQSVVRCTGRIKALTYTMSRTQEITLDSRGTGEEPIDEGRVSVVIAMLKYAPGCGEPRNELEVLSIEITTNKDAKHYPVPTRSKVVWVRNKQILTSLACLTADSADSEYPRSKYPCPCSQGSLCLLAESGGLVADLRRVPFTSQMSTSFSPE